MARGGEERTIKARAAPGSEWCTISSRLLEFNLIHFTSFFCSHLPLHPQPTQHNSSPSDSLT
jgi:hypothetical protein